MGIVDSSFVYLNVQRWWWLSVLYNRCRGRYEIDDWNRTWLNRWSYCAGLEWIERRSSCDLIKGMAKGCDQSRGKGKKFMRSKWWWRDESWAVFIGSLTSIAPEFKEKFWLSFIGLAFCSENTKAAKNFNFNQECCWKMWLNKGVNEKCRRKDFQAKFVWTSFRGLCYKK